MRTSQGRISGALAGELNALGVERDKKVACLVLIGDDEMEMVWPPGMDMAAIDIVERAIMRLLQDELGE